CCWGTCAIVDDKIYVIGGCTNASTGATIAKTQEYDPVGDSWGYQTDMPHGLYGITRENPVINDIIYVSHGKDAGGFYDTLYSYDPSTDDWDTLTNATYSRDGTACGVIGNRLYVVGGRDAGGALDYNEVLNIGEMGLFWVEVDSIPADPDSATIHTYYGKADAETTSSGPDTFVQFDDFNDNDLDPDWTVNK
ncbi:unnamed protein product, partial [marine sediment metagenome]